MPPTRRQLLSAVGGAATLPLAGCMGGDTGGTAQTTTTGAQTTTATETTTTEEQTETTQTESDSTMVLETQAVDPYGEVVVGPEGQTLYMFEKDPSDGSETVCTGDCAEAWPPLTVEDPETITTEPGVTAPIDTVERPDGAAQVALDGWPLYYFQGDSAPGDVAGQGVGNVWWVLQPDGTPVEPVVQVREQSDFGPILTGPDGMTLYMFEQDSPGSGQSSCSGGCADAWPPLVVDSTDVLLGSQTVDAPLGTIERMDGSLQVTVDGWPVYYFQNDEAVGDVAGQGVQDAWWVLGSDGSVIRGSQTATTRTTTTTTSPTTTTRTTTTPTTTTEDDDDGNGGGGLY